MPLPICSYHPLCSYHSLALRFQFPQLFLSPGWTEDGFHPCPPVHTMHECSPAPTWSQLIASLTTLNATCPSPSLASLPCSLHLDTISHQSLWRTILRARVTDPQEVTRADTRGTASVPSALCWKWGELGGLKPSGPVPGGNKNWPLPGITGAAGAPAMTNVPHCQQLSRVTPSSILSSA